MPNWCEGNIRFRGKQKDIKRFLMNEIVVNSYEKDDQGNSLLVEHKPNIDDKDYVLIFTRENERGWFYFRGTHRNFIEKDSFEVYVESDFPDDEIITCIDGFRASWSFEYVDKWVEHAKKYQIDVRLVGYERGMLFSQIKTIYRDGKIKEEVKEYVDWNDWMWNATLPNNGG